MQTPAAVYQQVPTEVSDAAAGGRVSRQHAGAAHRSQGKMQWKKHEVFVSQVLWGERVGLLPIDDRCYKVYFAQIPLALFDSDHGYCCLYPPGKATLLTLQGKEMLPLPLHPIPSTQRSGKCQVCARSKLSGMCPSGQFTKMQNRT